MNTHEDFIQRVRDIVVNDSLSRNTIATDEADKLRHTKLVYGVGDGTYRGVCHYDAWSNGNGNTALVEIAASAEESWIQLAGTTIHELAHVLTHGDGHGKNWKDAAMSLGFTKRPAAAGQLYYLSMIRPTIRRQVYELARSMSDGTPSFLTSGIAGLLGFLATPRPCGAGTGTRGGKSQGKGSGSRLRLWECQCEPKPVKVRIASDDFRATCNRCGQDFEQR